MQLTDHKPKIKFIVQASLFNWQGTEDLSFKKIDGEPVIFWVLKKIRDNWHEIPITVALPESDRKISLPISIKKFEKVDFLYGPTTDVLKRINIATREMDDNSYFVRVLGGHLFFSALITKQLISHAYSDLCDWVKPPDDYEIQLTSEVIRVGAIRKLNDYLISNNVKNATSIKISPIHFVCNSAEFNGHKLKKLSRLDKTEKLHIRQLAKKIYLIDRTEINYKKAIRIGNQLTFHYEIASKYINKKSVVFDVACGEGFGTKIISKKSQFVVGADIDPKVLNFANKFNYGNNILYLLANANRIPFTERSFDFITSMETIEHLNRGVSFLKELKRVLKSKGVIAISTPQNRDGKIPVNPHHFREYSLKELIRMISAEFKIEKVIGIKTGRLIIEGDPTGSNTMIIARKV